MSGSMRRLADLNGKKHVGAPVFVMPACTIHQKHDNLQGSGDARKPIDLETQKREADIPASPIGLRSRTDYGRPSDHRLLLDH